MACPVGVNEFYHRLLLLGELKTENKGDDLDYGMDCSLYFDDGF
jgi:hypothetical protein